MSRKLYQNLEKPDLAVTLVPHQGVEVEALEPHVDVVVQWVAVEDVDQLLIQVVAEVAPLVASISETEIMGELPKQTLMVAEVDIEDLQEEVDIAAVVEVAVAIAEVMMDGRHHRDPTVVATTVDLVVQDHIEMRPHIVDITHHLWDQCALPVTEADIRDTIKKITIMIRMTLELLTLHMECHLVTNLITEAADRALTDIVHR